MRTAASRASSFSVFFCPSFWAVKGLPFFGMIF